MAKLNFKEAVAKLGSGMRNIFAKFPRSSLASGFAFDWSNLAGFIKNNGFYGSLLTLALCMWFLADLASIGIGSFIPEPPPVRVAHVGGSFGNGKQFADYEVIFGRNLFNSEGKIPGEERPEDTGAPQRTTLPFNLIGTVILKDELKSIATIEDKSASQVFPVRIQDEIPSKARILQIEPRRVVFLNVSTGRKEFVDIPEEGGGTQINVERSAKPTNAGGPGVERVAPNQFNVARTEVDKAFQDLPNVLTQARCIPNFENGLPAGYKCFQIVPGSIYEKLGIQNGDVICGINNDPLSDLSKAMEKLNELRTASHLEICIKRDGRQQNLAYEIR